MRFSRKETPITEHEKEYIIKLFKDGKNCKEISKQVPYSHDTVWNTVKKAGYTTTRNILEKLSDADIKDICNMYKAKIPTSKILEKYNMIKCQNTIIKIVKSQGVQIRTTGVAPIIENEYFFDEINTEEKAYILGLLIADGSIIVPNRSTRNPAWSITLHDNDKYMLEKIKEIIGLQKKICHTRNESILTITSKRMVDDLFKYGVVPRKSFITYFPENIPDELKRHVVRGIFDGDGCISNGICSFYGTTKLLEGIQKILADKIQLPYHKITIRETNGANPFGFAAQQDVLNFYHFMYDDATMFLSRKHDKFLNLNFINQDASTVVTEGSNDPSEP